MEEYLQILIMPDYDSARELMGYDVYSEPNYDDIILTQSNNIEVVDVKDDDIFIIKKGLVGQVNSSEDQFLLKKKSDLSHKEDFLIEFHLLPGKYKYSEKNHVIFRM